MSGKYLSDEQIQGILYKSDSEVDSEEELIHDENSEIEDNILPNEDDSFHKYGF